MLPDTLSLLTDGGLGAFAFGFGFGLVITLIKRFLDNI